MLLALVLTSGLGGVLLAGLVVPAAASMGAVTNAAEKMIGELPQEVTLPEPSEQSVMRWADGSLMARFYAENRIIVSQDAIAPIMADAVVAIEDKRFFDHNGVDPTGIMRALVNNITGGPLEGASTLTQQYVRNSLIEAGRQSGDIEAIDAARETTIGRKLREISLALAVEKEMSKEDILNGYLNIAQFGPSQYGVEAAAQHYFSKSALDLNPNEAALLAGITQSPNRWDPVQFPDAAQNRRNVVLGEMVTQGYIDQATYDAAIATPVPEMLHVQKTRNGCAQAGSAAYFCEYVVKDLLNNESWGSSRAERTQMLYRGGLIIETTLDPALQQAGWESLVGAVPVNDASGVDASLVTVQPGTGHIVTMVQNTDWGDATEERPDATQVNVNVGRSHGGGLGFQAGSSFKVFTLVEWVRSGRGLWDSVSQEERNFRAGSWKIPCDPGLVDNYSPNNLYKMTGDTTVLQATKLSTNLPFIHMANRLDLCEVMGDAAKLGVERGDGEPLEPRPSAVLGTNNVTPLSMANAFASLANRGSACKPVSITRLTDTDGNEYTVPGPQCEQVIEQRVADTTTYALSQVMTAGGTGSAAALRGRPSAGKTGTANDAANAWFVGYTPQYSTAVWLGHRAGNKSMQGVRINGRVYSTVFGSTISAPIWRTYMNRAHQGLPVQRFASIPQPPRRPAPTATPRTNRTTAPPATTAPDTSGENN